MADPSTQEEILAYLKANPEATYREIAEAVGMAHPGSIHFVVSQLLSSGKLERTEAKRQWIVK